MSELTIYPAQPVDYPDLLTALNEGTERKLRDYNDPSWGEAPWTADDLEFYGVEAFHICREAEEGLAVAAFALRWKQGEVWEGWPGKAGYLSSMVVRNSHRGRGIGKQMVEWAAEQAVRKNCDALRLDCGLDNIGLHEHYESLGFVMVGIRSATTTSPKYRPALFEYIIDLCQDG